MTAAILPPGIVAVGEAIIAEAAGKPKKQPTQARKLVDIALAGFDIVEDEHGKAFAVPKKPPRIAIAMRGRRGLTSELRSAYFERYDNIPAPSTVTGAVDLLEAQATGGDRVALHLRCARTDDGLVVDLGGATGEVVVVKDGSWSVQKSPPDGIVFRRSKLTAPLPRPAKRGSIDALRDLIDVSDEGWSLIQAWLVLAWLPDIPVPILCVTGQQGAGKSVLGRTLVSIVDPSAAPLRSMPHNLGEWQTTAAASRVVGLDNVSRIKEEMSDAFCRATTGEGAAKRELYTDEDLVIQTFRRALLLTSIDPGALKGDLGERLLPVELLRPTKRRGEAELDALLESKRPAILAGLFSLIAEVVANPVTLADAPRMADAANVMAAVDRAAGTRSVEAYARGQASVAESVLESDPLAMAVVAMMKVDGFWSGTPTSLFERLGFYFADEAKNRPANVKSMSERLQRIVPQLESVYGLQIEVKRGDHRIYTLRRADVVPPGRRAVIVRRSRTRKRKAADQT